ncbi:MAG: short chain dehydrogenase [Bacteroidetes bacterium]|nr:MAG: short chain dehydrogenase [Bacteroidota bacterium]
MKIFIIGGEGTIGKRVTERLAKNHEVIVGGRNSGDVHVDISDSASIERALNQIGKVDAIVNVSGEAKWDKFEDLSEEDFYIGIKSKLMGQVNLVRIGKNFINKGGSITLTTGILADDPVDMTTSAAMVNGGIHSFVKAVALELDGVRVNVVSPGLVADAYEKYKDYFPGYDAVGMDKVVNGYVKSVEGKVNGQIINVRA